MSTFEEMWLRDVAGLRVNPANRENQETANLSLNSILQKLGDINNAQLADNHQVLVSNFPAFPATYPLPATQFNSLLTPTVTQGTNPWVVSGTVTAVPSGNQNVSVTNFPTTYPAPLTVSAIDNLAQVVALSANQLPDNHQVQVSNFPTGFNVNNFPSDYPDSGTHGKLDTANAHLLAIQNRADFPLPAGQLATLTPQKDALTETQARTFIPDEVGTWDYKAGVSGAVSIVGRVLQITATATTQDASLTINGGDVVPVPVGRNITIEPRANLVDPEIVFTDTTAYFVELLV